MGHQLARAALVKSGGIVSNGTGALTPIEVNLTGYEKALIVVNRGQTAGATNGTVVSSVYHAASSGGTYALIAGSLGTSGTSNKNKPRLIDLAINPSKPFLKVYGTNSTAGTAAVITDVLVIGYRKAGEHPVSQDLAVTYLVA